MHTKMEVTGQPSNTSINIAQKAPTTLTAEPLYSSAHPAEDTCTSRYNNWPAQATSPNADLVRSVRQYKYIYKHLH